MVDNSMRIGRKGGECGGKVDVITFGQPVAHVAGGSIDDGRRETFCHETVVGIV